MQIHDANLKHNGNWSYRNSTSEIILHHAEASSRQRLRTSTRWHLERGWAGIGYNYYVRKDGTIWRGRPGMGCWGPCKGPQRQVHRHML